MTTNQVMKDATLDVATKLLKANNTVTTLEVKVELRKDYPHFRWRQHTDVATGVPGVSELMAELEVDSKFTFTDNGTYRIYSSVGAIGSAGPTGTIGVPTMKLVTGANLPTVFGTSGLGDGVTGGSGLSGSVAPRKTVKRISKTKALDLLQNSKGHFVKVVFTKKDGTERILNCQYIKDQTLSPLGIVKVKESSLLKKLKKTGDINAIPTKSVIRSFNINSLKTLGMGGETYKIKN